jgi:hypothetical protein
MTLAGRRLQLSGRMAGAVRRTRFSISLQLDIEVEPTEGHQRCVAVRTTLGIRCIHRRAGAYLPVTGHAVELLDLENPSRDQPRLVQAGRQMPPSRSGHRSEQRFLVPYDMRPGTLARWHRSHLSPSLVC